MLISGSVGLGYVDPRCGSGRRAFPHSRWGLKNVANSMDLSAVRARGVYKGLEKDFGRSPQKHYSRTYGCTSFELQA